MIRNKFWILLVLFFAQHTFAQTADEIIAKNLQARGGLEKLKSTNSVRMIGTLNTKAGSIGAKMEMKRPNLLRMEFSMQDRKMVQAYDGKTAWEIVPMPETSGAPHVIEGEDAQQLIEDSDFDGPFVNYAAKGHTVELLGKEDVNGASAFKIKLTLSDGTVRNVYFDASSFLEIKQSSTQKHQGNEMSVETYMGDYQPVDGFMVAHTIENRINGEAVSTIHVDKVELNADLDESRFHMPEAK